MFSVACKSSSSFKQQGEVFLRHKPACVEKKDPIVNAEILQEPSPMFRIPPVRREMLQVDPHGTNPSPSRNQVSVCHCPQFRGGVLRVRNVMIKKRKVQPFHVSG